jgi:hypothetical protein
MEQEQTTQTSYFGKIPKCKACHNDIWIEGFACKCGKKEYYYEEAILLEKLEWVYENEVEN